MVWVKIWGLKNCTGSQYIAIQIQMEVPKLNYGVSLLSCQLSLNKCDGFQNSQRSHLCEWGEKIQGAL